MRTLDRPARGLGLALAAGLAAAAGCDDVTAGTLGEDPGPPRLLKVLIVDPAAGVGTDLLNDRPPAVCRVCPDKARVAQCAPQPCVAGAYGYPSPPCDASSENVPAEGRVGVCPDPLARGPAPVAGGIRLVFSKLLDPAIEQVSTDQAGRRTFLFADGVLDLVDPDGASVPARKLWDPGGSPTLSPDPLATESGVELGVPFGPALAILPNAPLDANARYTIRFDPSKAPDRKRQAPVDKEGKPFPGPVALDFTTADLALVATLPVDLAGRMPTLAPNHFLQLAFNAAVDETSPRVTLQSKDGTSTAVVSVFHHRGDDPAACDDHRDPTLLDLVPVDATGPMSAPQDLAEGVWVLTVEGVRAAGRGLGTPADLRAEFLVRGPNADPSVDAHASAHAVLPEPVPPGTGNQHCEMPGAGADLATGDDMTLPPADGGSGG